MRYACRFILILFIVFWPGFLLAEGIPSHYVEDRAGVISPNVETALNGYLQELEQKTGVQMVILTIDSTNGIPIEEYSIDKAMKWGLGQKDKDNGLLMVVAVKDRKYRIEVGYGLEPILPDSYCGTVARRHMVPYFRQGDYSTGIYSAALVLIDRVAKAYNVQLSGMPKIRAMQGGSSQAGSIIPFVLFILLISLFLTPHSRGLMGMLLLGTLLGGSWGGRSGGGAGFGSFGGGGFGAFGGGGGGTFGGGGVSGGW